MRLTAEQSLQRLMGGRKRARGAQPITLVHSEKHSRVDRLYVFETGDSFVVTPADDTLPTILGVCDESGFDATNPAMKDWLEGLAKEIAWYQRGEEEPLNLDAPSGRVTIAPMVKAKWNQTSPYNKNLNFGDGACYVGCCAVATAEIMHHWMSLGYERGSKAIPPYTTSTKKYKVSALPSIPLFDYANMTVGKPKTAAQINAVATLMEYVSKSIKSDFRTDGTGAYNSACVTAMTKYFRMGNPTQVASSSMKAAAFEEIVYNELAQGRPVFMSGAKAANAGGHAFVCDGYDAATGLFHFNWGWGGSGDGYFALNALTPTGRDYSFNKRVIIGINPYKLGDVNGDGKINVSDVMKVVNVINSGKYDEKADVNSDGKIDVSDVMFIVNKILSTETLLK